MENVMTLDENVELCRRMSTTWDKGVDIFDKLESKYSNEPERILEIGLAKALGIQFRSGYNILHFYQLREEMFRMEGRERLDILKQLESILREELFLDKQFIELCENDSRLGFHSAAEGYKYFPAKILWRMQQLEDALANDLPELKKLIREDKLLFPEYTGKDPAGAVAYAIRSTGFSGSDIPEGLQWQRCSNGTDKSSISWSATYDKDSLYIIVSDSIKIIQDTGELEISSIIVRVEPRRLWPCAYFYFNPLALKLSDDNVHIVEESGKKYVIVRIPFNGFWWSDEPLHPLRVDVRVRKRDGGSCSWLPNNPLPWRLVFGTDNYADLGWLVFK
jgi:hypothetical protein